MGSKAMLEYRLRNLIVSGYGTRLQREGDLIRVTCKDGEETQSFLLSPHNLEQVIIAGECTISSGFVRLLIENNVDLVFIEHQPIKFFARVVRSDSNMITELWRKQLDLSQERRLMIAREIEDAAIYNKMRILQRLSKDRSVEVSNEIDYFSDYRSKLQEAPDMESLMGIEGISTRQYFGALRQFIPPEFGFSGREKHPPPDPINALLSYGYTVLLSRVEYSLLLSKLNPFEGIIHSTYRDRPALGFDLMEEFRQPIIDRVVLSLVTKKEITPEDFESKGGFCTIKESPKRLFLDAIYSRFEEERQYGDKRISYLDIIFSQAKKLAEAITGRAPYEAFRWR